MNDEDVAELERHERWRMYDRIRGNLYRIITVTQQAENYLGPLPLLESVRQEARTALTYMIDLGSLDDEVPF